MKPKSMKLRFLITLHALMKYSDKNHRMNGRKLNEYLRPYNVEYDGNRALGDTVRVLREFGFDVKSRGEWDHQGVWIDNRPLPTEALHVLVFAVTTNPHITKEQAEEILGALAPLVTVYQEPMLKSCVVASPGSVINPRLYEIYGVVCEAIQTKRRVRYCLSNLKYDKETQTMVETKEWPTLFTPKCIYQKDGRVYMLGYNNTDSRIDAVDLRDVCEIKMAFKHTDPDASQVQEILNGICPAEHVPDERGALIYKGPAVFYCRGQYLRDLYRLFGPPAGPVIKDKRCRSTYHVQAAEVYSKTLAWLVEVPDLGVRIKGPEALVDAVRVYYDGTVRELLNPKLPANPALSVKK